MIFTGGLTREQAQIQRRALLREIAAEHRKKEHEKLVKLREQLRREVLRYRVERRRTVRQCRAERKQAKKNAKALRQETHDRLKATARESVVAAREACRKEKEAARALVRRESLPASPGPNPYEAKKAARIARMRTRAKRLLHGAEVARQSVRSIGDMIPFGQPILVGHHSERRHRRDLERIRSKLDQSLELGKKAKELERRAERAEKSTAISSDDPDAIAKLRAKLTALERDRARMVAANKAVRSAHPREALAELGFSERLIERILMPDPMGHVGFP
ncbi:MAG TPA: DUF3560 domain-containing protein, partial [Polyangiaceae bacterium]|nr:DUF3560 domain-containing protein [Polyangiaceae bacterium]